MTGEWLKTVFGADRLNYYNMGIGGTPSKYGLLRFKRDVASHNPHLVFIEFDGNVLAIEGGLHSDTCAFDIYCDGDLTGSGEPWYNNFRINQLALSFLTTDLPYGHHKVRVVARKSNKNDRKSKHLCIYNVILGRKFDI